MFKLYNYFHEHGGYGEIGVLLTFFIYFSLMIISMLFMYFYIRHAHMNGRLMDVYTRITGPDNIFFVPYDSEVSEQYLKWVCAKAHAYKNLAKDSRKIAMREYVNTDSHDPSFEEKTTHILIYNVRKNKERTVYRQFIKLPNGSICEVGSSTASSTLERMQSMKHETNEDAIKLSANIFAARVNSRILTKTDSAVSFTREPGNLVSKAFSLGKTIKTYEESPRFHHNTNTMITDRADELI